MWGVRYVSYRTSAWIFELAKVNDVLKLKDLTDKFNISIETLRRDLSVLEKQGKIQKFMVE